MKRLHVSIAVDDLAASIAFYTSLFNAPPTREEPDYAKWMLDDPRVNFALSARNQGRGVDHLGIQVDSEEELAEVASRAKAAGESTFEQNNTTCCYARSDKVWLRDPQGVPWETFFTKAGAAVYGSDTAFDQMNNAGEKCCLPAEDGPAEEPPVRASGCC